MAIELNHTIVWSCDKLLSARFFAEIFGLPEPVDFSHFKVVTLSNGVSLDFADKAGDPPEPQHYAMLVSEDEFDGILARIRSSQVAYWADPMRSRPGTINHNDGGRGVYFEAPDGHLLEAITVPYGGDAR